MELKELLKEARKQTGMTQKQFAEYFRIPYRTLEDWERGVRHIAELEMEKLAEGLSEKLPD